MADTISIASTYCGPPNSGNGGYTSGKLAEILDGQVEVTLRAPPPLNTDLTREVLPDGTAVLSLGDQVIANAKRAELEITPPPSPTFDEATEAMKSFVGFDYHTFPSCFVCGPERGPDGLRLFTGPVDGPDLVASTWCPSAQLADASGNLDPVFLWAALDCPSAFVFDYKDLLEQGKANVLGRLNVKISGTIKPGERCIVIGWKIGDDGRKHYSGSALYRDGGELVAAAMATWITIDI